MNYQTMKRFTKPFWLIVLIGQLLGSGPYPDRFVGVVYDVLSLPHPLLTDLLSGSIQKYHF